MKKLLGFCIALFFVSMSAYSQNGGGDYRGAIGARVGTGYYDLFSASLKTFLSDHSAIEANLGFGTRSYYYGTLHGNGNPVSISASGAFQYHFNIPVEGLKWFVGGGLTVANSFSDYDEADGASFGIFPTGGVDYKFPKIPLNLTADLRPTVFLVNPDWYNSFYASFGISARYTFR